jgi:hypothetical protein
MPIDWFSTLKNIPDLLSSLSSLIKNNQATKDLLLRELRLNLKAFQTAHKTKKIDFDKLLDLLHNEAIQNARKNRFLFNSIKTGTIDKKEIRDERNYRYQGKDCNWLFKNIDEKIEDLRNQKQYYGSLNKIENTNIALQFSNLFYKLKLLVEYIH